MLVRAFTYLVLLVFSITAYGLFSIKDRVSALNSDLQEVNRQLIDEKNRIHMLKAEISYLSSPDRLRKLVNDYFELEPVKTTQMIKDPLHSRVVTENASIRNITPSLAKRNVQWRYKRVMTKYLQTVSNRR